MSTLEIFEESDLECYCGLPAKLRTSLTSTNPFSECIHLQERLEEIEEEHDNERAEWEREKAELTSQLLTLQAQLDDIQNRIRMANESCLMPPLDALSVRDDDVDDTLVIYTL